eukprot:5402192-Alexandrium_andersonii.AAC.1
MPAARTVRGPLHTWRARRQLPGRSHTSKRGFLLPQRHQKPWQTVMLYLGTVATTTKYHVIVNYGA